MKKYNEGPAYESMNKSQQGMMDYIEETGFYRGCASREMAAWEAKRAKMTPEELEEIKQKDELDKWTGTWMLIGLGVFLAVVCAMLIIGELTGNSLTENFTGVFGGNN